MDNIHNDTLAYNLACVLSYSDIKNPILKMEKIIKALRKDLAEK